MSDNVVYKDSVNDDLVFEPMAEKRMVYVQDINNGVYNGQVILETSSISNSNKWVSWSEGYLIVPYTVSLKGTEDITALVNSFSLALKNGSHQIIDSLTVEYGNQTIIQNTRRINEWINWKLLSNMSVNDQEKLGVEQHFYKDTSTSVRLQTAASTDGIAFCNNLLTANASASYSGVAYRGDISNDGLYQRQKNVLNFSTGAVASTSNFNNLLSTANGLYNVNNARSEFLSHMVDNGGAGAARVYQWHYILKVPLKLIDFFDKTPLIKGSFIKLTLNYNSVNLTSAYSSAGATSTGLLGAVTSFSLTNGTTNPVLITSGNTNNPLFNSGAGAVAAGSLNVVSNVGATTSISGGLSGPLNNCRLYVPLYTLQPSVERNYLRLSSTKKIQFEDVYMYEGIRGIATGASANQIISNGIKNIQSILIVPYYSSGQAPLSTLNATMTPIQSPYDTSPATTSPLASITNIQIQISGMNLLQQSANYTFESFVNEVSKTGVDGGIHLGLSSGLISSVDWNTSYRFYYFDASRRLTDVDNSIPRSVQVSFTNNTQKTCDYIVFVSYLKELTVDLTNGAIVE